MPCFFGDGMRNKKYMSPKRNEKMKGWVMIAIVGILLVVTPLIMASGHPTIDFNKYELQRFKGVWGFMGDNETCGHIWGIIEHREGYGFVKGWWNKGNLTVDVAINASVNRITGVFKNGYFNGYITINGKMFQIVGLYEVNSTENSFYARWMTENRVGWAYGEILPYYNVEACLRNVERIEVRAIKEINTKVSISKGL